MDPLEALEWQRDLLQFNDTDIGRQYLAAFFTSLFRESMTEDELEHEVRSYVPKVHHAIQTSLRMGETYAVDDEMIDLVRYAAESLPDDTVHRWTMPSEFGFALMPRSEVYQATAPRAPVTMRAFSWATWGGQVHVFFYSDNDDIRAEIAQKYSDVKITPTAHALISSHLSFAHGQAVTFGTHVRSKDVTYKGDVIATAADFHDLDWSETIRMTMTVLAFWHLCQQTIATSTPVDVPRHAVKRWRRAGGIDNHVVRVVRLRRRSGPSPAGEGHEWHHRWIVRGHWRQQPCGPGKTQTRPVWIAPYVKGPEDAPLLDSTKINYLVR